MESLLGALLEPFRMRQKDRLFYTVVVVITTLMACVLALSAIAVWPIVFAASGAQNLAGQAVDVSWFAGGVILAGGITCAISLLIALATPIRHYRFLKVWVIGYIVGFVVMLIMLFVRPIPLQGVREPDFFVTLLRIVINLALGVVACVLPSLLANLAGLGIRALFTACITDR